MASEINVLSPHWREVATHAVAFTAAVLVLRRYAWRPILGLLDERRARIESEFDGIEKAKAENAGLKAAYDQQLRTIDAQARAKIQEAVAEGRKVAGEIHEEARKESRDLIQRAREEIELEKDKAELALKEDMVRMSLAAAEKAIHARLDSDAHRRLIEEAIDEMVRVEMKD
ncbi:MAG: F0F1 ATP synthase subunit B [Candidatus Eisenbacteria bacterium]|nr:F0F1 ATP synthase subunit B [Candidatus Eisenbacteria bacterium]